MIPLAGKIANARARLSSASACEISSLDTALELAPPEHQDFAKFARVEHRVADMLYAAHQKHVVTVALQDGVRVANPQRRAPPPRSPPPPAARAWRPRPALRRVDDSSGRLERQRIDPVPVLPHQDETAIQAIRHDRNPIGTEVNTVPGRPCSSSRSCRSRSKTRKLPARSVSRRRTWACFGLEPSLAVKARRGRPCHPRPRAERWYVRRPWYRFRPAKAAAPNQDAYAHRAEPRDRASESRSTS